MSLLSRVPRPRPRPSLHRPPRASFAVRLLFTPILTLTQAQTIHNLPNPIHDIDDTPPPDNVNPLLLSSLSLGFNQPSGLYSLHFTRQPLLERYSILP